MIFNRSRALVSLPKCVAFFVESNILSILLLVFLLMVNQWCLSPLPIVTFEFLNRAVPQNRPEAPWCRHHFIIVRIQYDFLVKIAFHKTVMLCAEFFIR